jgi:ribosomal protein S27AE
MDFIDEKRVNYWKDSCCNCGKSIQLMASHEPNEFKKRVQFEQISSSSQLLFAATFLWQGRFGAVGLENSHGTGI